MLLPDAKRVIYQKNPLIGVFCQLDFPTILRIDTEAPALFQEKFRQRYPIFEENRAIALPPQVGSVPIRLGSATYRFLDNEADASEWAVTLTNHTVALSTSRYERWEEFRERLAEPLEAFIDVYSPAFFTRLGLRYQNLICRSKLNMEDTSWKQLFNVQIAGIFSAVNDESYVEHAQGLAMLKLDENRKVRLQHGLVIPEEDSEECYLVDNDIYSERQTEVANARNALDSIKEASGRVFRWCITDKLHNALEPIPIQ